MVHMVAIAIGWVWLLGPGCGGPASAPGAGGPPADTADTAAVDTVVLGFDGIREARLEPGGTLLASWAAADDPVDAYEVVVATADGRIVADAGAQASTLRVDVSSLVAEVGAGEVGPEAEVSVRARAGGGVDPGDGPLSLRLGPTRLELLSFVPLVGIGDVWGDGDRVVVAGRDAGWSWRLYDVSDPTEPAMLADVVGEGYVRDVKLDGPWLYTSGECGCIDDEEAREAFEGFGLRVFDVSDPRAPVRVATLGGNEPGSVHRVVHNVALGDDLALLAETPADAMPVVDVADPTQPVTVSTWLPPDGVVHDQVVVDDVAWVAWWKGFSAVDLADPAAPVTLLEHQPVDVRAVHNVWPTADARHLLVTSETAGGHLSVFDVADPAQVHQVAALDPYPGSIIHNVVVDGSFAFVSWYREGLVLVDLADPASPRVIDRFDTLAHAAEVLGERPEGAGLPFSGAWGVWPFGDDGLVAVSDQSAGLFLLRHHPVEARR